MSLLYVDEFTGSEKTQNFTLPKRFSLAAIRPKLYVHNDPAGSIALQLRHGSTVLFTRTITFGNMRTGAGWTANQYHYGFINYELTDEIILYPDETYTLALTTAGAYSFSESAYAAWVIEHEFMTNSSTSTSTKTRPLTYQLWGYKNA